MGSSIGGPACHPRARWQPASSHFAGHSVGHREFPRPPPPPRQVAAACPARFEAPRSLWERGSDLGHSHSSSPYQLPPMPAVPSLFYHSLLSFLFMLNSLSPGGQDGKHLECCHSSPRPVRTRGSANPPARPPRGCELCHASVGAYGGPPKNSLCISEKQASASKTRPTARATWWEDRACARASLLVSLKPSSLVSGNVRVRDSLSVRTYASHHPFHGHGPRHET